MSVQYRPLVIRPISKESLKTVPKGFNHAVLYNKYAGMREQ